MTFKKQYIKFIEGNQESLNEACKKAESLWYKRGSYINALSFKWVWLLVLRDGGRYLTTARTKELLIEDWYVELEDNELTWVYVSDVSEEHALDIENKKILICSLPWNARSKYICVSNFYEEEYKTWLEYEHQHWKYAVPVPKEEKKERIVMMTDKEWEEFQKTLIK